jgi:hypothetical protein
MYKVFYIEYIRIWIWLAQFFVCFMLYSIDVQARMTETHLYSYFSFKILQISGLLWNSEELSTAWTKSCNSWWFISHRRYTRIDKYSISTKFWNMFISFYNYICSDTLFNFHFDLWYVLQLRDYWTVPQSH